NISDTVCENNLPFTLGTQSLTSSGIYTEVFTSVSGCDSTVILALTVNDTFVVNISDTVCETELPYPFGTQSLISSGIYTELYTGANSCDSTVVLNLTVNDTFVVNIPEAVCETDLPFVFGTQSLTSSGIYTEVFTSASNCDSTVVLTLTVNDTSVVNISDTVCETELPYVLG